MSGSSSITAIGKRDLNSRSLITLMSIGILSASVLVSSAVSASTSVNSVNSVSNSAQKLIMATEGKELSPYYIEGRNNEPSIGYGFNVRQNILSRGPEKTKDILIKSGIPREEVAKLMNPNRAISEKAKISPESAKKLLDIIADEQTLWVRGKLGSQAFSKLPQHQVAAAVWFAYSGGAFQKETNGFFNALSSGDTEKAMRLSNYTVTVNGKKINNPNVVLMQVAMTSDAGFKKAVSNPDSIRAKYKSDKDYAFTLLPDSDIKVKTLRASTVAPEKNTELSEEDKKRSSILSGLSLRTKLNQRRASESAQEHTSEVKPNKSMRNE